MLVRHYSSALPLPWSFVKPSTFTVKGTYLLFPAHPGSLRWKLIEDRQYWAASRRVDMVFPTTLILAALFPTNLDHVATVAVLLR